jgi:hypothetical protein
VLRFWLLVVEAVVVASMVVEVELDLLLTLLQFHYHQEHIQYQLVVAALLEDLLDLSQILLV